MRFFTAALLSVLPGFIKLRIYRALGMQIGTGVRIGFGTLMLCRNVRLHDRASIGKFCLIRAESLEMGKRAAIMNLVRIAVHSCVMKSQTTIWSQNEIAGDLGDEQSTLYMGPASGILQHCYINVARPITLGRNVGVGGGSYLFTHGMWLSRLDGFPVAYGPIAIADDVWLPWGCFILPNITIGSRVVVGARSVVTKSLPAGVLAAGVPAKVIKEKSNADLTRAERLVVLEQITQSLAIRRRLSSTIETGPLIDEHYCDEVRLLVIHKEPGAPLAPLPSLNVVFEPLDERAAKQAAVWSLTDYRSSPYDRISPQAHRWFAEARTMGVRFYPIDEDFA